MPVVPRIEPQVREQAPRVGGAPADAPVEAFGGGAPVARAAKEVAQSFEGLFAKEKEKADRVRITDAEGKLLAAKNDLLWNQNTGAMMRKGQDAFPVLDEYGQQFNDKMIEIRSGLTPEQQMLWDERASRHQAEFTGALQRHVFTQRNEYDDEVTKVGVQQVYDDIIMNRAQPGKIAEGIAKQEQLIREYADRQGKEGEIAEAQVAAARSRTHSGIILAELQAGNTNKAAEYFKRVEGQLTPEDIEKTKSRLDAKLEFEQNVAVYDGLKKYRLSDGAPDLSRMKKEIFARKDLSTERKEEVFDYVKAAASEEKSFLDQRRAATDHEFMNKALGHKANGKPLQTLLDEVTTKYGGDRVRKKELSDIAKKIYASAAIDDPMIEQQIWDDIMNNRGSPQADIMAAMRADKLKGETANGLLRLLHNHKARFEEQDRGMIYESLKELATEKFGANREGKEKTAQYLSEVRKQSQGKSPEEAFVNGKRFLQDQPAVGLWQKVFGTEPEYVRSAQDTADSRARRGQMEQDFGDIVTDVLGGGDPAKLDSGLKALGYSAEELKTGKPANSAIQSLKRMGLPVTKKNIAWILSKNPTGVVRGY